MMVVNLYTKIYINNKSRCCGFTTGENAVKKEGFCGENFLQF